MDRDSEGGEGEEVLHGVMACLRKLSGKEAKEAKEAKEDGAITVCCLFVAWTSVCWTGVRSFPHALLVVDVLGLGSRILDVGVNKYCLFALTKYLNPR